MTDMATLSQMTFRPLGPGDFLRHALSRAGVSQEGLAEVMSTSRFTINQIVRGKRTVTPSMALKLSKALGTSIHVWLNVQREVDLFDAYQESRMELDAISPIKLDPVVIHELEWTDSEIEVLAGSKLAAAYPSFEAVERSRSKTEMTVCVFSPDSLVWIEKSFGIDEVSVFLDRLVDRLNEFASQNSLTIYHYHHEALALVDNANGGSKTHYEMMFSSFPTSIQGSHGDLKMTLSGGISTCQPNSSLEDTADDAADLMYEVRRFRSGEAAHCWSDKKKS